MLDSRRPFVTGMSALALTILHRLRCQWLDDDEYSRRLRQSRGGDRRGQAKHFGDDCPYQIMKVDGQPSIVRPMFIDMPRNEEGAVEWPPFVSVHSIVSRVDL